jgi:hypothetical protein
MLQPDSFPLAEVRSVLRDIAVPLVRQWNAIDIPPYVVARV